MKLNLRQTETVWQTKAQSRAKFYIITVLCLLGDLAGRYPKSPFAVFA